MRPSDPSLAPRLCRATTRPLSFQEADRDATNTRTSTVRAAPTPVLSRTHAARPPPPLSGGLATPPLRRRAAAAGLTTTRGIAGRRSDHRLAPLSGTLQRPRRGPVPAPRDWRLPTRLISRRTHPAARDARPASHWSRLIASRGHGWPFRIDTVSKQTVCRRSEHRPRRCRGALYELEAARVCRRLSPLSSPARALAAVVVPFSPNDPTPRPLFPFGPRRP